MSRRRVPRPNRRPAALLALLVLLVAGAGVPPAAAIGLGSLTPPHADLGVDTNGDRLFNYLRIDVRLRVDAAGTFTVGVLLNDDLDLAELTQGTVTVTLAPGSQAVSVLLDGSDIYNGGVDGPFFAHITLLNAAGTTLGTGVHTTAAYRFGDFQPFAARIVPPVSERTLDNDTDGLIDWIDLGLTLDVSTAASYRLASHLTDTTYTVSEVWTQTVSLSPGRTTLRQLFLGYPLRLAERSGPYLVTNSLYDSRGVLIDFLFVQTQAYAYTSFEAAPARLAPPHADAGEDLDADGLFNALRVDVGLLVEGSGTFTVRGELFGGGSVIQEAVARVTLGAGSAKVALRFSGSAIYEAGISGPYRVRLTVFDSALRVLSSGDHWTAAYAATSFEPVILYLVSPHQDFGVDFDGDGKFEVLRLVVRVDVRVAATVRFDVSLRNGVTSEDLLRVSRQVDVSPAAGSVSIDVPGADLIRVGQDGPYRLWIEAFDPQGRLIDEDNHRSQPYLLGDFELGAGGRIEGIAAEAAEDPDGDGAFNRLRVRVLVNVTDAGRYRLDGTLSAGGVPITSAASAMSLGPGAGVIDLVFAGRDIRRSGLSGPYQLGASLAVAGNGAPPFDAASLATSGYQAASFGAASLVTLTGRVLSEYLGTPLAGATVWVLDYANAVSREATTDATGAFVLSTYAGSYRVIVDHPGAEARTWSQAFAADASLAVSLGLPRRVLVHQELTWTGWGRLLVAVRIVYAGDSAAVRFRLDWAEGNRDGVVQPGEASLLAVPPSPFLDGIGTGTTAGALAVNGIEFVQAGAALWTDLVSGDVALPSVPALVASRPFVPSAPLGTPTRAQIDVTTYYDAPGVDHRVFLYIPAAYRFASSDESAEVVVAGRRIPFIVDPYIASPGSAPARASASILLLFQSAYVPPIPSAPTGVAASLAGTAVALGWTRPTNNVDGTRIANLAGYNVYRRASILEPWRQANVQLVTSEWYLDRPGAGRFFYSVTAVNTDGVEGPRSQETSITVPGAQLAVSVVDPGGGPVAGASLSLADADGRVVASGVTDARGRALLLAPFGEYRLEVGGPGVSPRVISVTLSEPEMSLTVTVERRPTPVGLPEIGWGLFAIGGFVLVAIALLRLRRRPRASLP